MRAPARRPLNGLSLLEVIVVLLIAAATCLLLLPVLNRSRENARASYCGNNLRRLEQSLQEHVLTNTRSPFRQLTEWELRDESNNPQLRESRLLKLKLWPTELQPYLDTEKPQPEKGKNPLGAERPVWLTCPSHPEIFARENPSHALYALVEVIVPEDPAISTTAHGSPADASGAPRATRRSSTKWKFRDCPRELPPVGYADAWVNGPVLFAADAQQQLLRQNGPHVDGVFQQSNLKGGPDRLSPMSLPTDPLRLSR